MAAPLPAILSQWQNFYSLIGAESATLIGLMFVAASIGGGIFTPDKRVAMQSFLSPTVVHFSMALIACLLAQVPDETWTSFGTLGIVLGLSGAGYSGWTWYRMAKHDIIAQIDVFDRLFYAGLSLLAYLLFIVSGFAVRSGISWALGTLALALIVLLLAGIRNAWDMTTWIIQRRRQ